MTDTERIPTTKRLADALRQAGAPESMIHAAEGGAYDDFKSGSEQPIVNLVHQALAAGLQGIAERAIDGEFDAPDWEAEEWLTTTKEGQEVGRLFGLLQERVEQKSQSPTLRRKPRKSRR